MNAHILYMHRQNQFSSHLIMFLLCVGKNKGQLLMLLLPDIGIIFPVNLTYANKGGQVIQQLKITR